MLPSASYSLFLVPALLLTASHTHAQDVPHPNPAGQPTPPTSATALLAPAPQPAGAPFNLDDNSELVYRVLNDDGKVTGEVRQRVVRLSTEEREESKKRKVTERTALIKSGLYDKKKLVRIQDLTFRARRDTCFTDGLAETNFDALRSFRDRKLAYSSTPIAWPNNPTPGSRLADGGMEVQISSSVVNIATVSTMLRKRQIVGGLVPLTTPAGTFQCYKVEAERENATVPRPDMAVRSSTRQIDFYAPGVGIVRTEIYGKNGKLAQVIELTSRTPKT